MQVADQIWICEKQTVTKWDRDIIAYKDHLKAKVMKEANKQAKQLGIDKNVRGKNSITEPCLRCKSGWS